MKKLQRIKCFLFVAIFSTLMLLGSNALAALRVASVSGNWDNTITWGGQPVPTNADDISINAGVVVTMNVNGSCLTIADMAGDIVAGGGSLTISGNAGSAIADITGTATISCPVEMPATATITVTGELTISNVISGAAVSFTKSGTGKLILTSSNTFTGTTSISAGAVNIQNSSAFGGFLGGSVMVQSGGRLELEGSMLMLFNALSLDGEGDGTAEGALYNVSGSNMWAGPVTINGAVTRINNAGGSLILNSVNLKSNELILQGLSNDALIAGTISSSTGGGRITKTDAGSWTLAGNNTFNGGVTLSEGLLNINSQRALGAVGGTFTIGGVGHDVTIDNTSGAAISLLNYSQVWNNNFTFTGSGDLNLGAGDITMNSNIVVTTLSGVLTAGGQVNSAFDLHKDGPGEFQFSNQAVALHTLEILDGTFQSTSSTGSLSLAGDFVNYGAFNNNSGTVIFNGSSAQAIGGSQATVFNNLTLNNTGGATIGNNETVDGTLTLTAGNLTLGAYNLMLGTAAVAGSPSVTNMIIADGTGECRRTFAASGSYLFPIGDASGTSEYSPITLNFTSGTYSSAYAGVKVADNKHPDDNSTTDFITRYWSVSQSGISSFSCDLTASFPASDVNGSVSNMITGEWTGSWQNFGSVTSNTISASGVTSFGAFTGIENSSASLSVSISASPSLNVCTNSALTLTANPTGVPAFTYLWSPNGETTQSISPSTAAVGSVPYSVTVTDGNGITATDVTTVTISAQPVATATPALQSICSGTAPSIVLTSTVTGTTFNWTVVQSGVSGAADGTGVLIDQVLSATGNSAGTATYTITPSVNGCNGLPVTVIITVKPVPVATSTPNVQTICSGSTTAISLNSDVSGTNFVWVPVQSGVSGASAGSGATIAQSLTATSTSPGTVAYTVAPIANGCAGTSIPVSINVNPIPVATATPSSQTVCSGLAPSIALTGNVTGTTFTWSVVQSGVSGATSGSGNAINQILTATGTISGTATYKVWPAANSCSGSPRTVLITVNPSPTATATPSLQSICSATATSIALSSNISGTSFTWTVVQSGVSGATAGSGTSIVQALTATGTSAGTATYTVTPVFSGCTGATKIVTVTVNPVPNVTATPSSQSICSGNAPSIALTSNVSGTSFSWSIIQSGVVGGSTGSGSTIAQTLTATSSSAAGTETYVVTPSYNSCNGTAVNVVITVKPNPITTVTPASQTICSGSSTAISLTGSVAGSTFAWTVSESGVSGGSAGTGNSISQVLSATGTSLGTDTYSVVATANACSGSVKNVAITVNPTPVITATPSLQTICSGAAPSVTLTSNVAGTTFTWTVVQSGVSGATAGSGTTISQALTATSATLPGTATYTITPTANSCNGTPITVVITVNPNPVATATPSTQTICSGTAPSIALSGNITGTTFAWTIIQSGVTGASSGSGNTIAQTLTATGTTAGIVNYTVTPTSNGCPGATKTASVIVNPLPVVTATPASQAICSSSLTSILLTSNVSGTTFAWTVVQSGVSGASVGSGSNIVQMLVATGTNSGTATYSITLTANSCSGTTITVPIMVTPVPVATVTPATQTICSGAASSIALTSNITGTTFSWTVVQSGVSGAFASTGATIAQSLSATGSSAGTATYSITPTANSCVGSSKTAVITVNPIPVVTATPSSQTICSGTAPSVALTSNVLGTSFSWTVAQSGVTGATAGSGNSIAQVITASGAASGTATYSITPSVNGCDGVLKTVVITVNPLPVATATPASQTLCSGSTSSIALGSNISGTTFSWTVVQSGVSGASAGSGIFISQALTATGTTTGTATYTVTPALNSCLGIPIIIVINVNPLPVLTLTPSSQTICSAAFTSIALTSNVAATSFTWTVSQSGVTGATAGSGSTIAQALTSTGTTAGTATYTVTPVANSCGGTSKSVVITVNPAAVVTATPASQSICSGTASSVALTSNVTGTTFGWTVVQSGVSGASAGSGSTIAQTLSTTGTTSGTATYTIIPTANGCAGISKNVIITVNPTPATTATPSAQSICSGATSSIALTSSVTGTTFAWSVVQSGVSGATSGSGATIAQTLSATGNVAGTATYSVTPTSNSCTGASTNVIITAKPSPTATATPASQSICSSTSSSVALTSNVAGTTFDWTVSQTGVTGATAGSGSSIAQTLTATGVAAGTATYTITPTASGCSGATKSVVITVTPVPVATATPSVQTICSGSAPSVALTSTVAGTTFAWTVAQSGVSGATAGTGTSIAQILTATGNNSGTATYTITPTVNSCSGLTKTVVITVNPIPVVTATPSSQAICSGTAPSIALSSNISGSTFAWSVIQSGVSGASVGSGASIAQVLTATGTNSGTATYAVTATANSCTGTATNVVITVNPSPVASATPSSEAVCSGSATSIVLGSNVTGTTFSWTVAVSPPGSITGASGNSGSTIAQTLVNTTILPATATYNVTLSANGCPGSPVTVVVTVNAIPDLTSALTSSVCSNASFSYSPASNLGSTSFSWTRAMVVGIQNAAGSGTGDVNEILINTTGSAKIVTYVYTLTANGCSRTRNIAVTVYPTPVLLSSTSPSPVCSETAFNYTPLSSVSGTLFTWTRAAVAGITNAAVSGSGSISETLINTTNSDVVVPYVITLTADGCPASVTVSATIKPKPVLTSTLTPSAICSNSAFSYIPASNVTGTTFSWSRPPVAGISNGPGFGTGNPNEILVNTATSSVNVTYIYTLQANSCSNSQNVIVPVYPNPVVNNPGDQEFCSGIHTPVISLTGSISGSTFSWTNSNTSIGLAAAGTGDIASFVTTNSGSLPIAGTVTITPSANGCAGVPISFSITVNPTAVADVPANQDICNGAPSSAVIFTGTLSSISWSNNHPEIGLAASGSGNIGSFAGINPGTAPIVATITAIPHYAVSGSGCDGAPVIFTITVNPTPIISALSNEILCAAANHAGYVFSTTASGGAPVYSWVSSLNIGFGTSGTGNIPPFTATNAGINPVTAIVSANVTLNGCTGGVINFTVTVNPAATVSQPANQTLCSNTLTSAVHFAGTATSFTWINSNTSIGLAASGAGDIGSFTAVNGGASAAVATVAVTPVYTGAGKTCPGIAKSYTYTINPIPAAFITGGTTVCQNASSPLLTLTGLYGTAPYTFTYQINAGADQTVSTISGNSVTVSVPTGTAGTFTYKITNITSTNGCSETQSSTAAVIVEAAPTATISGTTAVCQNSGSPLITFTGATGIAPYTFTYQVNGGVNQVITTSSGNSVTLAAPTVTAGTFVYSLVKVASSTGCSNPQAGSATVTVNPTPSVVITNPAAVCSPLTADLTAAAITAGSTAGLTFTYWTNAAATIVYATPTTAAAGTYYIKGTNPSTGCYSIKPVTVTVNPSPTLVITNPAPVCAPGTVNLTAAAVTAGSTAGLTLTYWTDAAATASYTTPGTAGDDTYYIKGTTALGCYAIMPVVSSIYSTVGIPVFALGPASSICKGSAPITYTANVTDAITLTYSLDAASRAAGNTINASTGLVTFAANYTGTSQITATATGCGTPATAIHTVVVNPTPTVTLVASPTTICEGQSVTLTATSSGGTVLQTTSGTSSGSVAIPDNSRAAYSYSSIALSGSGGATLASSDVVMVTVNITHGNDADLDMFLVDPSGTRAMLLSSDNGGTGNNYSNTVFRTDASTAITSGSPAFTGTYLPEGSITTAPDRTGASGGNNYNAVVPANALNGASVDGTWSLRVFDDASGSSGTLTSWSLSIIRPIGTGYTSIVNGSPVIGTVNYSGSNNSIATSIVTPPSGTQTYTVTTTDGNGCTGISNAVSITVKPAPVPTITADYCTYRPKVRLITPTCASCTYAWNTGATTNNIDVDIAGNYTVNVTYANGCSNSASIGVAEELVTDGSFTNFNAASPAFFTEYTQQQSYYTGSGTSGLWPEGYYAVNTSAWSNYPSTPQGYHTAFHGRDHTNNSSGARNFLMVNGSSTMIGSPARLRIIWQQTVTVTPNTDYYFSAWGMNLNPTSPARLQFEVNGVAVGSIADLNTAEKPTTEAMVGLSNWVRFYSTPMWNSGASTTAVIRIINLNTAAGGNDFGLDDISFGTLANVPFTSSASSNSPAATPICSRGTLQLTSSVSGGRAPIVYSWTGPNGFTSSQANPTIANIPSNGGGTYTLSVTDYYNCPGVVATTAVVLKTTPEIPAQTTTICSGSAFTATPVNGVPNAATIVPAGTTYSWAAPVVSPAGSITGSSAGSGLSSISQTLTNTTSSVATVTYSVTPVAGGCSGNAFNVVVTVNPAATANGGGNRQICAGSTVTLNGSVGGAATTGNWTGGTGTFNPNRNTLNAVYTPSAAEITAGTVTLTLNSNDPDGAGPCSAVTSAVVITINSLPALSSTKVNASCNGSSTGSIDLTVSAGTPAYSYSWTASSGGLVPSGQSAQQDLTTLKAGTYTVVVNDTKTCSATTSVSITEPTLLVASESHTTIPCSIGATSVTVSASGGTPAYTGTGIFAQFAGTTTYTVSDTKGCTATVSATVVADPNTAPVISTTPVTRTINGCSTANISGPVFSATSTASSYLEFSNATNHGVATDNCAITTVTYQDAAASSCPIIVTRTWTLGDASGLTSTCQQIINVSDVTAPVWTTAAGALNRTVECSDAAGLAAAMSLFPTAADACDADVSNIVKTSNSFVASLTCPQKGTYTNTWKVSDDCGNTSATYTQIITVTDNTAPAWITAAGSLDRTVSCSDAVALAAAQTLKPVASDLCDANVSNLVKVSGAFVQGSCSNSGTYTNTWTVADDCGNTSSVYMQHITVTDNIAPVWLTVPSALNRSVECNDAAGLAAAQALYPLAWDNCDANVTNIVKTSGSFVSSGCVLEGTYTNTWLVSDDCGNTSAVYTQVISVENNTDPAIICPVNTALSCDSPSLQPSITGTAVATGDCAGNPTVTWSDVIVAGSCSGNYHINRTWTATNICGTQATCMQTIFVQDVAAPVISCAVSGNQNIYPPLAAAYIHNNNSWDATATDNCSGATLTASLAGATISGPHTTLNGVSFNEGVTKVTWTAIDGCGNHSQCSFTVTVAFKPQISCQANINRFNEPDVCGATLDPGFPTLIGGTAPITFTWTMTGATSGSGTGSIGNYTFNGGITTIAWTATNVAGSANCSQTITISDNQAPDFVVVANKAYCVKDIVTADFFDPTTDIVPVRPDFYLFAAGTTDLDLNPASFTDNCPASCSFEIRWRMDFEDGTSLPALPATYITGQPSAYGTDILLPGNTATSLVHHITYQIVDCSGNVSAPKSANITINPRPDVIKLN